MSYDELRLGAATVVNIADHFDGMKAEATLLAQAFHASERGFFTPTEDEQTRHLLVSYWTARNALFELVSSLHQVDRFEPERRGLALAIAYAGALVLVDGARFLRESFHHRPVVRSKLNEPEPHYGIPRGTYDLVQKSLTSTVHAWHLYHAAKYVQQHWSPLNEVAKGTIEFQHALSIIPRLQHRLDVTVDRYLVARTRVRARALRTRLGTELLGRALYGLQKLVSQLISEKYLQSGHKPHLPSDVEASLQTLLQPGDVIITRKEHAITNYFLPGYWPHAALYIGTTTELQESGLHEHDNVRSRWQALQDCDAQRPNRVLESLKDGVRVRSLAVPLSCDAVTVIRPTLSRQDVLIAIGRGFFHDGKPYDFDFDFSRSDRMVCTEVVYRSYEGIGGLNFELTRRAGRLTLSAEDLLKMALNRNGFQVVVSFCPLKSSEIASGGTAEQTVRETIGRKNPSASNPSEEQSEK
ncbi:MAG: YiiX/YebB-like N1pC/P60 family cysteine hydrolase [Planctomycetaceae bacterium]